LFHIGVDINSQKCKNAIRLFQMFHACLFVVKLALRILKDSSTW